MEILEWKSEDLKALHNDCKTVGDVINKLESIYWNDGKVICEISVDGKVLDDETEKSCHESSFEDVQDLQIKVSSLDSLIVQTKKSVVSLLREVADDSQFCAKAFRKNQVGQAQEVFDNCIQKAQMCLSLTGYMAHALIEKKGGDIQQQWSTFQNRFLILSKELFSALKSQDFVVVSDLLEYELTDLANDWTRWISEI